MKRHTMFVYISLIVHTLSLAAAQSSSEDYKIVIEPMWQDLDKNDTSNADAFGGKWILAGSITFEKKAKETVSLHRLHLQWLGTNLKNLTASLYRKMPDKDFYPIEANLICDGIWCENKQTLIFTFNEQQTLSVRNIFYLVLTVPNAIEYLVKQGSFSILSYTLPEPFRPSVSDDRLCLSLDAIGSVTTHVCRNNR